MSLGHQNGSNVRRRTDGDQSHFSHGCMDGLEVIPEQPKTVPELAGTINESDMLNPIIAPCYVFGIHCGDS